MQILSHRGYWLQPAQKNELEAFARTITHGFGTETDIRDRRGDLVVSHDPPADSAMRIDDLLPLFAEAGLPLALNIKADGLASWLRASLDRASIDNAFVFDMSIPDMIGYFSAGIPVFTRMSEVEREPVLLSRSAGVWLDSFERVWFTADDVERLLEGGHGVCVVSPELHGRPTDELWDVLADLRGHPLLSLCTDEPERAQRFFGQGGDE